MEKKIFLLFMSYIEKTEASKSMPNHSIIPKSLALRIASMALFTSNF